MLLPNLVRRQAVGSSCLAGEATGTKQGAVCWRSMGCPCQHACGELPASGALRVAKSPWAASGVLLAVSCGAVVVTVTCLLLCLQP